MSTHAIIRVKSENNTSLCIRKQGDGYPEVTGAYLAALLKWGNSPQFRKEYKKAHFKEYGIEKFALDLVGHGKNTFNDLRIIPDISASEAHCDYEYEITENEVGRFVLKGREIRYNWRASVVKKVPLKGRPLTWKEIN